MGDFRPIARSIRRRKNNQLRETLAGLSDSYTSNNLKYVSSLADICFTQIGIGKTPREYAKEHPRYSSEWGDVKTNATALRMALTNYIGRPVYEQIPKVNKPELADTLVAIKKGYDPESGPHKHLSLPKAAESYLTEPPDRTSTPDCWFDPISDFSDIEGQFSDWVSNDQPSDQPHAVYVIDCTPPINDECIELRELRRDVYAMTRANINLIEDELLYSPTKYKAAKATNECNRIYYVGETKHVVNRMVEHRDGASTGGAGFTNLVRPNSIVDVNWCERSEAKKLENQRVTKLNQLDDTYAFGG